MINTSLSLTNFRNHHQTDTGWGEHVNIITGPNGAGKTNLIDAIHYLCMGRSFTSNSDQYVIRQGERAFLVKGVFKGSIRSSFEVACSYQRGEGKQLFVNDSPLERHAELIGLVPVVLVSPEDKKLTGEGPVERRSFIDSLISQTSPAYLNDLIRYRKIIRQRNKLLTDLHHLPDQLDYMLEPWDRQLTEAGSRIVLKRCLVIRQFQYWLVKAHEQLTGTELIPTMIYKTFGDFDTSANVDDASGKPGDASANVDDASGKPGDTSANVDDVSGKPGDTSESDENIRKLENQIRENYLLRLKESSEKERERRQTITGPHRDDLVFFLNDMELRKFGSQGQHRIFALALKIAQLYYYQDVLDDLPVFLLDDVFGDLDPHKTEIVMNMLLQHSGQSFITAAHPDKITGFSSAGSDRVSEFRVSEGKLAQLR